MPIILHAHTSDELRTHIVTLLLWTAEIYEQHALHARTPNEVRKHHAAGIALRDVANDIKNATLMGNAHT